MSTYPTVSATERIEQIRAASIEGSANWDDPITDCRILLAEIDSLTRQRDEAQVQAADNAREGELQGERLRARIAELEVFRNSAQGTINHFRNRANKAEVKLMRVERLADAQDGRDGYVMVYALRAALAVTASPETPEQR